MSQEVPQTDEEREKEAIRSIHQELLKQGAQTVFFSYKDKVFALTANKDPIDLEGFLIGIGETFDIDITIEECKPEPSASEVRQLPCGACITKHLSKPGTGMRVLSFEESKCGCTCHKQKKASSGGV